MKKILITLLLMTGAMTMEAQQVVIYQKYGTPLTLDATAIDSIVFRGCSSGGGDNSGTTTDSCVTSESMVSIPLKQPFVYQYAMPTFQQLAQLCEMLYMTLDNCGGYTSNACSAWQTVHDAWSQARVLDFGPVMNYSIDPQFDTYPFDVKAFNTLMENFDPTDETSVASVKNDIIKSQSGLHALEYILFSEGQPRTYPSNSLKELEYAKLVAENLYYNACLLEAAWCGLNEISESHKKILYSNGIYSMENYGESLIKEEITGNMDYSTEFSFAYQLIECCKNTATSLSQQKLQMPSTSGKEYVESPYSYYSIENFYHELLGCKEILYSTKEGSGFYSNGMSSVISLAQSYCPDETRNTIETLNEAMNKVSQMSYPFVKYFGDETVMTAWKAIDEFVENLTLLEQAMQSAQNNIK